MPCSLQKAPVPAGGSRTSRAFHASMDDPELLVFRTRLCEQHREGRCLEADRCPHSHCQTWQRRNPSEYPYLPKLCPDIEFVKKGPKMTLLRRCNRGRGCVYAHSKEEELYHPMMYKTKLCNSHPHCARYYCPFAHSTREVRKPSKGGSATQSQPASARVPPNKHEIFSKSTAHCSSPTSSSTTASSIPSPVFSSLSPVAARAINENGSTMSSASWRREFVEPQSKCTARSSAGQQSVCQEGASLAEALGRLMHEHYLSVPSNACSLEYEPPLYSTNAPERFVNQAFGRFPASLDAFERPDSLNRSFPLESSLLHSSDRTPSFSATSASTTASHSVVSSPRQSLESLPPPGLWNVRDTSLSLKTRNDTGDSHDFLDTSSWISSHAASDSRSGSFASNNASTPSTRGAPLDDLRKDEYSQLQDTISAYRKDEDAVARAFVDAFNSRKLSSTGRQSASFDAAGECQCRTQSCPNSTAVGCRRDLKTPSAPSKHLLEEAGPQQRVRSSSGFEGFAAFSKPPPPAHVDYNRSATELHARRCGRQANQAESTPVHTSPCGKYPPTGFFSRENSSASAAESCRCSEDLPRSYSGLQQDQHDASRDCGTRSIAFGQFSRPRADTCRSDYFQGQKQQQNANSNFFTTAPAESPSQWSNRQEEKSHSQLHCQPPPPYDQHRQQIDDWLLVRDSPTTTPIEDTAASVAGSTPQSLESVETFGGYCRQSSISHGSASVMGAINGESSQFFGTSPQDDQTRDEETFALLSAALSTLLLDEASSSPCNAVPSPSGVSPTWLANHGSPPDSFGTTSAQYPSIGLKSNRNTEYTDRRDRSCSRTTHQPQHSARRDNHLLHIC